MIDSDVLNSDVTLTGVMEGKPYTITIKSNNSNNQTKTYSAKYGERFTLPSCPFSAVSGYTFNNYTCNGSTYSVGGGFTVTGNMTVTCNWRAVNLSGRQIRFTYWMQNGGDLAFKLLSYDPALEGIEFDYVFNTSGFTMNNSIELIQSNINKKIVHMGGVTWGDGVGTFRFGVQGYSQRMGPTTSSPEGATGTYTL